jgi:exodeoxyribonuclease VII small subunit
MMMKKGLSYSKAYTELQEISKKLENGEFGIDELSVKIKRAAELVNFCKEKLRTIEEDMNEVFEDDPSS